MPCLLAALTPPAFSCSLAPAGAASCCRLPALEAPPPAQSQVTVGSGLIAASLQMCSIEHAMKSLTWVQCTPTSQPAPMRACHYHTCVLSSMQLQLSQLLSLQTGSLRGLRILRSQHLFDTLTTLCPAGVDITYSVVLPQASSNSLLVIQSQNAQVAKQFSNWFTGQLEAEGEDAWVHTAAWESSSTLCFSAVIGHALRNVPLQPARSLVLEARLCMHT